MADVTITAVASGATLANAIAQFNSNIAALKTGLVGSVEGRGASTPNMAANTVDQDTLANNGSVCVWSAQAGFSGFVVSGLTYSSATGFTATYTSGSAWVLRTSTDPDQNRLIVVSASVNATLTASSDNYVYLKTDGTLGVAVASVGGPQPALPADTLLLSVATTDGSTVTGTPVDKRVISAVAVAKFWRSKSFWPYPSSTTNFRVPPGTIELEGTMFETTVNNDLDITAAGNMISGTRTSNAWMYVIAANNSGGLKLGLTMSAPSAATVIGGTTQGSAGVLQWRTIGSLPYRYLGAGRTSTTAVLKRFSRQGPVVLLHKDINVLSAGAATSFTSVACATAIPVFSTMGRFHLNWNADNANGLFVRANGSGADGRNFRTFASTRGGTEAVLDLSTAQKFDYKTFASTTVSADAFGWIEDLD